MKVSLVIAVDDSAGCEQLDVCGERLRHSDEGRVQQLAGVLRSRSSLLYSSDQPPHRRTAGFRRTQRVDALVQSDLGRFQLLRRHTAIDRRHRTVSYLHATRWHHAYVTTLCYNNNINNNKAILLVCRPDPTPGYRVGSGHTKQDWLSIESIQTTDRSFPVAASRA